MLIYTFNSFAGSAEFYGLVRNSGPFWEPGTFGGFLIIGIIINTVMKGNIIEKKNIVMIIALLTTLSTTNYIAFFLFILIYFIFIEKKTNPALVIIPLLAIFVALFFEVGFLHNKIFSQINEINMYYKAGKVGNRFVSAYVDLQEFVKHPIFGQGRGEITKQSYSRFEGYRTNGIITYLADFGLMFFLFYFSNLYISFYRFCSLYGYKKYLSMAVLFLLMMIGFSEEYYNFPFFYALTMLHLAIPRDFLNYFQVNGISKVNNNYYE